MKMSEEVGRVCAWEILNAHHNWLGERHFPRRV